LPLWKLKPADDPIKIDLLLDYPRDEYSQLDDEFWKRGEDNASKNSDNRSIFDDVDC